MLVISLQILPVAANSLSNIIINAVRPYMPLQRAAVNVHNHLSPFLQRDVKQQLGNLLR
jgi:hypothetical protein